MKYQFECGCGEQIADFTRGRDAEISTTVRCDGCGTFYALTITAIERKSA